MKTFYHFSLLLLLLLGSTVLYGQNGPTPCAGLIAGTGPLDDYDGDGACNQDDKDDDNDGILDVNEGCQETYITRNWTKVSNGVYSATSPFGITATVTLGSYSTFWDNVSKNGINSRSGCNLDCVSSDGPLNGGSNLYLAAGNAGGASSGTVTVTFTDASGQAVNVNDPKIHILGIGGSATDLTANPDVIKYTSSEWKLQGGNTFTYQCGNVGHSNNNTIINSKITQPTNNSGVFDCNSGEESGSFIINGSHASIVFNVTMLGYANKPATSVANDGVLFYLEYQNCTLDTDIDGIADQFDLDSDGDGCPDVVEGGGTFTPSDLLLSELPGGNTGSTYNGYAGPVQENLGNAVELTPSHPQYGVPFTAGTGQDVGTSQDVNTTSELCTSDLAIYKSVDDDRVVAGEQVLFTIRAENQGLIDDTEVTVTDQLPNGFTYVSHTVTRGTYNNGTGIWTLGSFDYSTSETLTITATVNETGDHTNTTTIDGHNPDSNLNNNASSATVNLIGSCEGVSGGTAATDDYDGDGVCNQDDYDDDNDGIFDEDEGLCLIPQVTKSWTISGRTASYDFGNGVIAKATITRPGNVAAVFTSGNFNNRNFWNIPTLGGDASLENAFSWNSALVIDFVDQSGNPVIVANPIVHIDRLGGVVAGPVNNRRQASARVTLLNGLTWTRIAGTVDFSATTTTAQDAGAGQLANSNYNAESGNNNASSSSAGSLYINESTSQIALYLPAAYQGNTGGDTMEFILSNICPPPLDTDKDGIFDHFDLDSDGDGCPDALEGSGTFVPEDLVPSTLPGGNTGGTYNGTAGPVQDNLGNTVELDATSTNYGVPLVAGAGQGVGTSQDINVTSGCIPGLKVEKYANTLTYTDVGDVISYTISVTNTGEYLALTDVKVTDPLTGLNTTIAELGPGENETFSTSYTITQDDIDNGSVLNAATATGKDPNGDPVTDTDNETVFVVSCLLPNTFNWSDYTTLSGTWPFGSLSNTYTENGTSFAFNVAPPPGGMSSGTPSVASIYQGNQNATVNSLILASRASRLDGGNKISTSIAMGESGEGLEGVHFSLFDVDGGNNGSTVNYGEQITVKGFLNGVAVNPVLSGTSLHTITGNNVVSKTEDAPSTGTGSAQGVVLVYFPSAVDNIVVDFTIASGAKYVTNSSPGFSIHDIGYCVVPDPAIAIVKTGTFIDVNGSGCADVGEDTIDYTFTVTNTGNVALSGVSVTDPLLEAPNPVVAIALDGGDTDGDGKLDITETWEFSASYAITEADIEAGSVVNQATAKGKSPAGTDVEDLSGSDATNDDQTVTDVCDEAPAIAIVKTGTFVDVNGSGCADVGEDTIDYTFTVTNEGNVALSGVAVTDPLLEAPNPVVAIAFDGGDTDGDGKLDITETWEFSASYAITEADIEAGEVTNQATAKGKSPAGTDVEDLSGSDATNDDQTVTDVCDEAPAIAIVKTGTFVDVNGSGCADVGEDTIDYTFTVTNEGNVALSGVAVTDPLLEAPNPVVAIAFDGGDTDGDNKLDIDETWEFSASYAITEADIEAGSVVNRATAKGKSPAGTDVDDLSGSDATNDDQTVTDVCDETPAIAIVKTGTFVDVNGSGCADVGEDTIDYTFTVTNTGNVALSGVAVTDPLLEAPNPVVAIALDGGDTDGDNKLDIDETWEFSASYAITEADIEAGEVTNQATAKGKSPAGTDVDDLSGSAVDNDDQTVTDVCDEAPAIAIVKTGTFVDVNGSGCADVGEDTIDYTFTVTNEGNVALSGVAVTDPLLEAPNPVVAIAFDGGDTDGDGKLDITETWEFSASYAITEADIEAGEVTNRATAKGTSPAGTDVEDLSGSDATNDDQTVTDVCDEAPAIAIVKTGTFVDVNGSGCADVGEDTIDYTFTVTNTGNVALSGVSVTDPLLEAPNPVVAIAFDGGDTDGDNKLDIDETWEFSASYAITEADIEAGEVTNRATAKGKSPAGTDVEDLSGSDATNDDQTVTDVCDEAPAIAIVKTGTFIDVNGSGCADVGEDTIDYTFTVTNEGNVALSGVAVTDPLLEAPNPVVAIAFDGGDTDGDNKLDIDETWEFSASYAITEADIEAGSVVNRATAKGKSPAGTDVDDLSGSDATNDDQTVTDVCDETPAIAIVKTGTFVDVNGSGCADVGEDTIDYTFTVTNTGNVALSGVAVTDPLLEAPNPVVAIALDGGDTDGDNKLDIDETWEFSASYAITEADIEAGEVTNQATAKGKSPAGTDVEDLSGSDATNDDQTVTDVCDEAPAIAIVKTGTFVDVNGSGCADVGEDTIDYTFTVTNEGNVALSGVAVTDPLLEAPNPVVAIAFDGGDTDGDNKLDIDETWEFSASYAITEADIEAGSVVNRATAKGTSPAGTDVEDLSGSDATNDDQTVTDVCDETPAIAIVKTGTFIDVNGSGCADVGEDTIDYTFTVTNEGNVALSGVAVTDPLLEAPNPVVAIAFDGGDTDGDGKLDITETWEFSASYAITEADIEAGEVTNQATAKGKSPAGTDVDDLSGSAVDNDDQTVTDVCDETPAIAIVKTGTFVDVNGSGCADVGEDTIDYTFTVTNEGNVALSGVSVTDPLLEAPNPVVAIALDGGDTDGDNKLDIDETWEFSASYAITEADIEAGSVVNQATAKGKSPAGTDVEDLSGSDATNDDQTVTDVCDEAPAIAIVKTGTFVDVNGSGCADVGEDTIDYTFTVTNEGNVALSGVAVTDPLLEAPNPVVAIAFDGGDTDGDGKLDITETWEFSASYAITEADIEAGEVTNQATAKGKSPAGTDVEDLSGSDATNDDQTVTDVCDEAPAIAIVKTGTFVDVNGSGCADVGEDTIDYTFTVTNEGNVALSGVAVTDPLLEAPNPVVAIAFDGGDTDGDNKLDIDETWEFSASYAITEADIEAGEVTNRATAKGKSPAGTDVEDLSGSDATNDDQTVTDVCDEAPAIAIVKTGTFIDVNGSGCADVGEDTIDYTFTVTNEGNVALSGVAVTDPLLEAPNPVVAIAFDGGDTDGDNKLDIDETWEFSASYAITEADIEAGSVVNRATAKGKSPAGTDVDDLSGSDATNDDQTVTDVCDETPAIAIVKTGTFVDVNGSGCADVGEDTIDYTFTVTNTGNVALSGVAVTDPLLEAPNPVVAIALDGGDTDGDNKLDIDETWEFSASYAITEADIEAGEVTNQATAKGTSPAGTDVEDLSGSDATNDDQTVTDVCDETPAIAIVKTGTFIDVNGSGCADVGEDTIDYTFTVTNEGNVALSGVAVTDPLLEAPNPVVAIAFDGGDTDGDGKLDITETWEFSASYAITEADIEAGEVTNRATAKGKSPAGTDVEDLSGSAVDNDDQTVTDVCDEAPAIAIVKTGTFVDVNGSGCADVGEDTIDYTFTVTNTGNVALSGVSVTDPLLEAPNPVVAIAFDGGDTDGDNKLDIDETWEFSASYAITEADIEAGEVTNQATAKGKSPAGTDVEDLSGSDATNDDQTVTDVCDEAPAIAIVKTGTFVDVNGSGCADVGEDTIDYTFTVTNEGNVALSGVAVTDPLLEAPNPVVAIAFDGGDTDGDNKLDIDETWEFSASYAITEADIEAGSVVNRATAKGTSPAGTDVEDLSGSDATNDDQTVTDVCDETPAIAIVKTGTFIDVNGSGCADVGEDTIDYTFTVTNEGNVALSGVAVTDPLLEAPNPVVAIAFDGGDTDGDGKLDITETWEFSASYAITEADIEAGEVTNQATAKGKSPAGTDVDDLSGSAVDNDDQTVTDVCDETPAIAIVKTGTFVDVNGSGCADVGEDTIDYTFTVTNEGNVALSGVSVTDPLLEAPNPVVAIALDGGDTDGDNKLDIDETWEFSASYAITEADIEAGSVVNQATAKGKSPAGTDVEDLSGSDATNDDQTVTDVCDEAPAIAIVKTGTFVDVNGSGCADVGEDTIDYTFTVTNEGNVALSGVAVTDPLLEAPNPVVAIAFDGGDTDGDGKLDITETWEFSASYAITEADIEAGEVTNQATAKGKSPAGTDVEDLSGSDATNDDQTVTDVCDEAPAIAIVKTGTFVDVNGSGCADVGEDTIDYTFTVTNEGNVALSGVAVTDPLLEAPNPVVAIAFDGGDTDGDNKLDIDETWEFSASYAITEADIEAGSVVNRATAKGKSPAGTDVDDLSGSDATNDDQTVTDVCDETPAIAIVKTGTFVDVNGSGCADVGEDTIDYTFTVTNTGNVALSGVAVTDPLLEAPNPVVAIALDGGDTDGDGKLDITETWEFSASYAITEADIEAGEVTNRATAKGKSPAGTDVEDLSGSDATNDDQTVTDVCDETPAIAIVKTGTFVDVNGSGCADVGEDTIDYTFTVTNEGNVALSGVAVTDPLLEAPNPVVAIALDGGDTDGDGKLDITETWEFSASYAITEADIEAGEVTNRATAKGKSPAGTDVEDLSGSDATNDDQTVTDVCDEAPAIAIVKTGTFIDVNGSGCADVGEDTIDYTFTVTNEGNVALSGVAVTDPLLEAPNPVVAIAFDGGDTDGDGKLDIDETWEFSASYAITEADIEAGEVTNQATAKGTSPAGTDVEDLSGSDATNDDQTVTDVCDEAPAIAIVKTGTFVDVNGSGCADVGEDTIDYTFTVTNTGNVALSGVAVTDPLLEAPNPVVAIAFDGGDTDGDNKLDIDETWEFSASYAITEADIEAGSVVNRATAKGKSPAGTDVEDLSGSDATNDDQTVTDVCDEAPAIAIVKTGTFIDVNGSGCADVGEDTIDYTFTVTNTGNVALSGVSVTDPLLEAPNPVVAIAFDGGDTDGDGKLDITETWEFSASYAITEADIEAGSVVNQATAKGKSPAGTDVDDLSGSDATNDDQTVTDVCDEAPAIAIVKTGTFIDVNGSGCADVGEDTIDYTFTVTNTGNVALSGVAVTDPLLEAPNPVVAIAFDGGDTDGDGKLDITETWEFSASYAITEADIEAGSVVNQATAKGKSPAGTDVDDLSGSDATNDDQTVTDVCDETPAIAIVKTGTFVDVNGSGCADVGEDTIDYTFTVTNTGNVALSGVSVTDPLLEAPNPVVAIAFDGGDTDGDGKLDITETWEFSASYAITEADIEAGSVVNQATAKGKSPAGTDVDDLSGSDATNDDQTVTDVCDEAPAIAIVKTGTFIDVNGSGCADVGEDTIDYTFTVTNTGNVALSGVAVTDPLLEAPNPVVAIAFDGGDTDGDGKLDITETWEFSASYAITEADIEAGSVVNQATAKGKSPAGTDVDDLSGSDATNDDQTVTDVCDETPAIAIVKTGTFVDVNGSGCADVGEDTIDYTFTVTNTGNVALSGVAVTDPLLEAPNPVVAIALDGGDTDGDNKLDIDETWEFSASYAITEADIEAGEVTNQATAKGKSPAGTDVEDLSGSDATNDDQTVTDVCDETPAIAIVKTGTFIDVNGSGCADVGEDTIDYTFTVTNEGNVALSGVAVTDPLLEAPNPVVAIAFDGGDTDGDGKLDITETWEFSASYAITEADIEAGEVTNQATAKGKSPAGTDVDDLSGSDAANDDQTVTDVCDEAPAIAIVKTGTFVDVNGSGCADVGEDTIDYTFTVTNEGNVALSGVAVTDPLLEAPNPVVAIAFDGGDTDGDGKLDITETWEFSASYAITEADIEAGEVTNQATAKGKSPAGTDVDDLSGSDATNDDQTVTDVCDVDSSISLEKIGRFLDDNENGSSEIGETILYTFIVTNTGNVTLYDITIEDPLPGININGGPIDSLVPGEIDSTTFTATYAITQEDIDNREVINQATVFAESDNGIIVMDESDDPTDITNIDNNGDGEPDDPTIVKLSFVEGVDFEIFNGITPNGDGMNDYFQIKGIENWPNNNMKIFNRWGVLVFETDGYGGSSGKENVFKGISEGRVTVQQDKELPTGTYFYILTFPEDNPGKESYNGYLYINR